MSGAAPNTETVDLGGIRVLVTGATSGLGAAMAAALAQAGARVIVTARDRSQAQASAAELGSSGIGCQLDVRDERSVSACVEQAYESWGGIDMLVNNAGIGMAADLAGSSVSVNILLPGGRGTRTGMVPEEIPAEVRAGLQDPSIMGPRSSGSPPTGPPASTIGGSWQPSSTRRKPRGSGGAGAQSAAALRTNRREGSHAAGDTRGAAKKEQGAGEDLADRVTEPRLAQRNAEVHRRPRSRVDHGAHRFDGERCGEDPLAQHSGDASGQRSVTTTAAPPRRGSPPPENDPSGSRAAAWAPPKKRLRSRNGLTLRPACSSAVASIPGSV